MEKLTKSEVLTAFKTQLQVKIDEAKASLNDTIAARDNESKSSAGDKYETGRAMAQLAQQQNEAQLNHLVNQYKHLGSIKADKSLNAIQFGSLILTNYSWFFMSIGIGNLKIKGETVYGMSISSPLGRVFKGKTKGDKISYKGKSYEILALQ